jgi:hypothetical protein
MDEVEKDRIVKAIRDYLARERMSREQFAFKTKLGKSTIDKLLIGLFSERTLAIVEERTGTSFRSRGIIAEKAADALGGYVRADVGAYEGDFLFLRPSFRDADVIWAFAMNMAWDDTVPGLVLRHADPNEPQVGTVAIPGALPYIYVQSTTGRSVQQLILSRMEQDLRSRGLLLTLGNVLANAYVPVAAPVVLIRQTSAADALGEIAPAHPKYQDYRADLDHVLRASYARLVIPAGT